MPIAATALFVLGAVALVPRGGLAGPARLSSASQAAARDADLARGARLLEQGAAAEAAGVLRGVVRRRPDHAEAHLLLGRALALVPEPTAAVEALRRAAALKPEWPDAHYTLGTALARFGDLDGARAAFERALELNPALADAHASLGLLFAQSREAASARRHLGRAIELYGRAPAAAFPHYVLAQLFREEQLPEEALTHLDTAIALRPDYAQAHASAGEIRNRLLDHAGAADAFEAAVRLAPEDAEARAGLGAAYLQLERPAEGIPHLERAVRLRPRDRTARYHLCRSYSLTGRSAEARECYRVLSERLAAERGDSDLAAARANRDGLALEAAGDLPGALERYRTAVALSPYATVLRRNLALAYCRLGRWDEGIAELKKVLDADPDDQDAIKALYVATEQARRIRR